MAVEQQRNRACVGGAPTDLLDAEGRLVVTPHPITLDGQTNVPADLRPGETLRDFLQRHVPGIDSGAWTVMIGGHVVPRAMWPRTRPRHGQLIACRAIVRKEILRLVAVAALAWFTMGAGSAWIAGTFGATAGSLGANLIGAGLFAAGSLLINKVLGPKVATASSDSARQVWSLSGQRNTARPYEPLPTLWGEMRLTPDLASAPYVWFEGDDQYLSTILLGGINVHSVSDLCIGDTPITDYTDVSLYYNGLPGHASQDVPLYSNADSIAGGELTNAGDWVSRTGSVDTIVLQLDFEGQLYHQGKKGIEANAVPLTIQVRPVGGSWVTEVSTTLSSASTSPLRQTYTIARASGQYEARAQLGAPTWADDGSASICRITWSTLRSVQADPTNYSQWGRIGIKIKATGQISGSLDTLRATYRARPMPVWTSSGWATATTRENGLSNPGAIILQALRGVYSPDGTVLQYGAGMSDAQIDIEGLKAFMLHCTARGYTYDRWVISAQGLGDFCQEVALAGMGQFSWTDGSRPTVVFVDDEQPIGAVVNMANMLKASFSVDYSMSNAADGIEYQYVDRDKGWETMTLRVAAPGIVSMLNPARITGDGVTTAAHAAVMARYHLAQSLYQFKTVTYSADIEHLDYRRLSVLSLSHDLTQWAHGGRLVAAELVGTSVVLTLDEPVPPLPTPHVGLRLPGERDYRVWPVEPLVTASNQLVLAGDWPVGAALPGNTSDNPAHDTLWCYDFRATPGYRVRVVSMEPEADLKGAKVACVPEGPEFWDYVLNGTYTPAPSPPVNPLLDTPAVSNLRVTELVHVQGDTEWYELEALWDTTGDFDHAQVWCGLDGSPPRLADGRAQSRASLRIDGPGSWLITVRPFDTAGRAGTEASLLYITTQVGMPPWNPQDFAVQVGGGGMRRFAWQYTSDRPANLAGMQIRYRAGSTAPTAADWDDLTPLGAADDVYPAQFESTHPDAGEWVFALRAANTAGLLANSVKTYTLTLPDWFVDIRAPDLTPPPAPTGVTVDALMSTALVAWDAPTYTDGQGPSHTDLYLAYAPAGDPPPVFADASRVGSSVSTPTSIPVDLGADYLLWAVHVSLDGGRSLPSAPVAFSTLMLDSDLVANVDALVGRFGSVFADRVQVTALSAAQLTLGTGTVGGPLKSSNYLTGSNGWILRTDGSAEFSDIVARGSIYSTSGSIGGIGINASGLNAGSYTGYAWPASGGGFHLGPFGLLMGNHSANKYLQVTADGDLYAPGFTIVGGNATFSGTLNAASGTFKGVLTADAINAVTTINLAGQAVTLNSYVSAANLPLYFGTAGSNDTIASSGYMVFPSGTSGVAISCQLQLYINSLNTSRIACTLYLDVRRSSDGALIGTQRMGFIYPGSDGYVAYVDYPSITGIFFDPAPPSGTSFYYYFVVRSNNAYEVWSTTTAPGAMYKFSATIIGAKR